MITMDHNEGNNLNFYSETVEEFLEVILVVLSWGGGGRGTIKRRDRSLPCTTDSQKCKLPVTCILKYQNMDASII